MMPLPPSPASAIAMASSPLSTSKPSGIVAQICAICAMFPLASFTPTMLSICASRSSVAGSMLTPVRPITLYSMTGSRMAEAIAR